ncbi:MAG: outer membrane beta-barrel protein [Rickettsiales bacterium]|jgi:opacity protein-like surface antigen|nr:outer membrane beta-barrel protein [Rickettsiales bacterium]
MKKAILLSLFTFHFSLCGFAANAVYNPERFRAEIRDGLDIVVADTDPTDRQAEFNAGELGRDVYGQYGAKEYDGLTVFVPTDAYVRGGIGLNLGAISAKIDDNELENGMTTWLGLGWDLSSYVRLEADFQARSLAFQGADVGGGHARELAGNLYFDLARRFVRTGDLTVRRTFVPYIGFGFGVGDFLFDDVGGVDGGHGGFIAPRGMVGFNVALTSLFSIDLSCQYSLVVAKNYGWGDDRATHGLSDIRASVRFAF